MSRFSSRRRPARRAIGCARSALYALLFRSAPLLGQADFANTDAGRPFRTQDAIVLERFAFESHLPNLRLSTGAGPFTLSIDPALAVGIFARTQLDLGISVASIRRTYGGGATALADVLVPNQNRHVRIEGAHIGVLHQLNVETLTLPAIALGAEVEVPGGGDGRSAVWSGMAAITRTWGAARTHLNARMTSERFRADNGESASPWDVGAAIDRILPLQHVLWGAEVGVEGRNDGERSLEWYSGAGLRWQWTMRNTLDAGVERRFSGERGWSVSLGMSTAFGVRTFTRGYR